MEKNYKIVVVGLGYVGLSNAVLLSQHNEVIGVDVSNDRVDAVNARASPIIDVELSEYLRKEDLKLTANVDLQASLPGADYVIVSTPTNYDEKKNFFDTSSVEAVISEVTNSEPDACIVVKSTIPVGFVEDVRKRYETDAVIFSPEFLREGKAFFDNLNPSRIIVGEKSQRAKIFANLLAEGALKKDIDILLTGSREAEAIKLFSNTYLAMRIAFFNELDSFAIANNLESREIVQGVSFDPRIGNYYNNPSFGYGGYCLPKDTKQLEANYRSVPQDIITAIVKSNYTRKHFLVNEILKIKPSTVGVYRLVMKSDSDNFRESAVIDLLDMLNDKGISVVIYEPFSTTDFFRNIRVVNNINEFKKISDIILVNRMDKELLDVPEKVFTRDLFGVD